VVRPAAPRPLAEEVHRLVVHELAASGTPAPSVAARRAPAPAAPAAPQPSRRAGPTRADRPAERVSRTPPAVDVGRLTESVSRRLARRGAIDDERRGMGR
jgi:hypothetical protein